MAGNTKRSIPLRHSDVTRKVGSWAGALFDSRLKLSAVLSSQTGRLGSAFGEHLRASTSSQDEARSEQSRAHQLSQAGMREIYARLYSYQEPDLLETPAAGSKLVQHSHGMLDELDEFKRLREQVVGDPDLSAIAAAKLAEAISKQLPKVVKNEKRKENDKKRELAEKLGLPVPPSQQGKQSPDDSDGYIRLAMRNAAQEAAEEVSKVRSALGAIPGMAELPQAHKQSDPRRMQLAERLATDSLMARVMKIAGRMRRITESNRKVKSQKSVGSVVGVTSGRQLSMMLPSERAMLRNPMFKSRQVMKLVQGQMPQYQMEGKENQGRGPMVVLLDTSGSMDGEPLMWGAAVTIACATIAAKAKRPFTLITFNKRVGTVLRLDKKGDLLEVEHYRGQPTSMKVVAGGVAELVLRISTLQASGGTSFYKPVQFALDLEESVTQERADLVIVTDGGADETSMGNDLLERLSAAKESGMRMYGLTVNGGSFSKAVHMLCDEHADIDTDRESSANSLPA